MNFFDVFWDVWKVRTSIKIQQKIENSFSEAQANARLKANLPQIVHELSVNNLSFSNELERQRKLIQIDKALKSLPTMDLSPEQKVEAEIELLKIKKILNN